MTNTEKLSLGRYVPRNIPSDQSLEDRAGAMFYRLTKAIKCSLFSSKRESPDIRIEELFEMDIYQKYMANVGVIRKSRGRDVHCLNYNAQLCCILGNKWYERILNVNGDFCFVVKGTVRFWLHDKNPIKEYFYVGDKLLESHIQNGLQLIFTFVCGDGMKAEYNTEIWK